jgi:DNA-binding beta-propeller fold protein YncE
VKIEDISTMLSFAFFAGAVTTVAGKYDASGSTDGAGTNARFVYPYSIVIGTDPSTLYVADQSANTIRAVSTSGSTSTLTTGQAFQGIAVLPSGTMIITTTTHIIYSLTTPGGCMWFRYCAVSWIICGCIHIAVF